MIPNKLMLVALALLSVLLSELQAAETRTPETGDFNNGFDFNSAMSKLSDFFNNKMEDLRTKAFEYFQKTYNKTYTSRMELAKRAKVFLAHYDEIRNWNNKYNLGQVSYKLKPNSMTDWTSEELEKLSGVRIPADFEAPRSANISALLSTTLSSNYIPKSKDWRESRCVQEVRYQGDCGCCYAFSTVDMVGAMRCLQSVRKKGYVSLDSPRSPQQIIDCATKDPKHGQAIYGCNGGWPQNVLSYLQERKRLAWDAHYPYVQREGECKTHGGGEVTQNDEPFQQVYLTSEEQFLSHVAEHGPIVATMRVISPFYYHSDGIFDHDNCDSPTLNHAVLIVGFGETLSGKKYWIVQNSWGEDWGEKGFYKLARGKKTCRIGEMGWGMILR